MDSDLNELIGKSFTVVTPISIGNDSQSSPNLFNITGIGVGVPIIPIQAQQQQSGGRMNKPVWSILWKLLSIVDDQLAAQTMHVSKSNHVSKIIDKCVPILNQANSNDSISFSLLEEVILAHFLLLAIKSGAPHSRN
jgi:hypothetical protein